MALESVVGGERARDGGGVEEMMNGNGKVVVVGGGSGGGYRWNGDAVPLKRRRVGLSNGGSMSDAGSSDEEEHEEVEEVEGVGEELSDYEVEGVGDGAAGEEEDEEAIEEEEEDDEDDDDLLMPAAANDNSRGGGMNRGMNRERDAVGYDDHDLGTEDDGFDEELALPDSPVVARGRGREAAVEMSSPDEGRDVSDDSYDDHVLPVSRGMADRGQASTSVVHREVFVVPKKPSKGTMNTAKRKAEVPPPPRNGGEPKPKKERVPSSSKKKANGEGTTRERTRFSTDNKARVTLERAREILAAVKAAMMKDPKHIVVKRPGTPAVENSSSSEDERAARQPPPSRAIQQVKTEEKVVKKRSRPAPKGDKEPAPRRRKPKVELDYKAAEEKPFVRRPTVEGSGHENAFKHGQFSTSGIAVRRESWDVDHEEGYDKKESGDDGYEQQVAVVEKKVARKRKKIKAAGDGTLEAPGLCPGSVLRNEDWKPPASPFGLIQESLYKDPWKILLSCMLLNKTAGRQMHKVIWDLFSLCPDAETAINMDTAKIAEKVYSLGLQNKRAKMIQRFSLEYLRGDWTNVTQLHGIGKYAADAYAIFCQGLWREVEPDDLMLVKYWRWLWETEGMGSAFTPDDS